MENFEGFSHEKKYIFEKKVQLKAHEHDVEPKCSLTCMIFHRSE